MRDARRFSDPPNLSPNTPNQKDTSMTINSKRQLRSFDAKSVDQTRLADIPTILSARHAHLSEGHHQERLVVATHEASHLLLALLTHTTNFGSYAYIRVPGRSSKQGGKCGVNGSIPVGHLTSHKADMMVSLAGSIFSGMTHPTDVNMGQCDQKDYEKRLAEYANEEGISLEMAEEQFGQMVIDETAATLVQYWTTIDWLAAALLLNCSADGDIKLRPIIDYFYADPKRLVVPARSTYFQVPEKHAAYVATLDLKVSIPNE